tara:strand:+ start:1498 stop:2595 length:1098 start_codon:yes stop_codon:yes gene_type:complete
MLGAENALDSRDAFSIRLDEMEMKLSPKRNLPASEWAILVSQKVEQIKWAIIDTPLVVSLLHDTRESTLLRKRMENILTSISLHFYEDIANYGYHRLRPIEDPMLLKVRDNFTFYKLLLFTEDDLPDTRGCIELVSECNKLFMELFVQTAEDSGMFRARMPPNLQHEYQLFGLGSRNVAAWNDAQDKHEEEAILEALRSNEAAQLLDAKLSELKNKYSPGSLDPTVASVTSGTQNSLEQMDDNPNSSQDASAENMDETQSDVQSDSYSDSYSDSHSEYEDTTQYSGGQPISPEYDDDIPKHCKDEYNHSECPEHAAMQEYDGAHPGLSACCEDEASPEYASPEYANLLVEEDEASPEYAILVAEE